MRREREREREREGGGGGRGKRRQSLKRAAKIKCKMARKTEALYEGSTMKRLFASFGTELLANLNPLLYLCLSVWATAVDKLFSFLSFHMHFPSDPRIV